jgi:hypothetical protein
MLADRRLGIVDTVLDRVLVKHDFEMLVSNWGSLVDINMRIVDHNYSAVVPPSMTSSAPVTKDDSSEAR